MTQPPCVGMHQLFESTDRFDHARARLICDVCPVVAWCEGELEAARATALTAGTHTYAGPVGTWAGRLVGVGAAR